MIRLVESYYNQLHHGKDRCPSCGCSTVECKRMYHQNLERCCKTCERHKNRKPPWEETNKGADDFIRMAKILPRGRRFPWNKGV